MKRILVVEDDKGLGNAMKQSLLQAGYAADWLDNVADALHALSVEHFDAMVLDLGLPDKDGYEVVRHLRQRQPRRLIHLPAGLHKLGGRDGLAVGAEETRKDQGQDGEREEDLEEREAGRLNEVL